MELSKAAKKDKSLISEAFARQGKYHSEWLMFDLYYRAQYSEKQWRRFKKTKRSRLFIPVTRNVINIVKSIFTTSFFSAGCPIEVSYVGDSDTEKANAATALVKHHYEKSKPYKELARAFYSALTLRIGITLTFWDSSRERIVTRSIFVKDVAFDFEATGIDDVQYLAYRFYESGNDIYDKIKSKFYKITKKEFFERNDPEELFNKRYKIEELIRRRGEKWYVRTFCDGKLMREREFERNPFQYGYAIDEYEYMDIDQQKDQILVYGGSMVELMRPIQDEINIKRNQKNDIQEEKINPTYFVGDGIKINPFDLKKGPGTAIKFTGKITADNFQQRPAPSEIDLNNDLSVLTKQDLEDATGVNGIMRGDTSASDRRGAAALSIINANSSPRIEDMILLLTDTLFYNWAKTYTYLALKHSPSSLIESIMETKTNPLGRKQERNLDFNIKVNFGASINKDARANDLMGVIQFVLQNPKFNPAKTEALIEEFLKIKLGENTNLEEAFKTPTMESPVENNEPVQEEVIDPNEEREKMLLAGGGA